MILHTCLYECTNNMLSIQRISYVYVFLFPLRFAWLWYNHNWMNDICSRLSHQEAVFHVYTLQVTEVAWWFRLVCSLYSRRCQVETQINKSRWRSLFFAHEWAKRILRKSTNVLILSTIRHMQIFPTIQLWPLWAAVRCNTVKLRLTNIVKIAIYMYDLI